MIINDFDGCKKSDIMSMSLEELQAAVIRAFSVNGFQSDCFYGEACFLDDIADAFRGRQC